MAGWNGPQFLGGPWMRESGPSRNRRNQKVALFLFEPESTVAGVSQLSQVLM